MTKNGLAISIIVLWVLEGQSRHLLLAYSGAQAFLYLPYLIDGLVALSWILIAVGMTTLHRSLGSMLLIIIWPLCHWPNMESIVAIGQPIHWQDISYLDNQQFLTSSLSAFSFSYYYLFSFACLLLLGAWLYWLGGQLSTHWMVLIPLGVIIFMGGFAINNSDGWQRSHPLYITLLSATECKELLPAINDAILPVMVEERLSAKAAGKAKNVLIIVLEGIPGAYINDIRHYYQLTPGDQETAKNFYMPLLSHTAKEGQITPNFVAHARQTIRGLYSILCGDYPKLAPSIFKSLEYLQLPHNSRPECLPKILKAQGYSTLYMQSAPLAFMSKDQFMPAIGFEEVYGSEWFEKDSLSGWGISDRALFERSLNKLQQQAKPWLATILTLGTHHPFNVSQEEVEPYPNRKLAAVAKLDKELNTFLVKLKQAGLTENTLIIVTADESHNVANQPYGGSWGLNIILAADISPGIKEGTYGLIDTSISILDYLGMADQAKTMQGRSLFRDYLTPRLIFFKKFVYTGEGRVIKCLSSTNCSYYQSANQQLFSKQYEHLPLPQNEVTLAQMYWQQARVLDSQLNRIGQQGHLSLLKNHQVTVKGNQTLITAGQFLLIPPGQTVLLTLNLQVDKQSSPIKPQLGLIAGLKKVDEELPIPFTLPVMDAEDQLQIAYSFPSGSDGLRRFNIRFSAISPYSNSSNLTVKQLVVSWHASPSRHAAKVERFTLIKGDGSIQVASEYKGNYAILASIIPNRIYQTNSTQTRGRAFLVDGWDLPEKWGTWSNKKKALIGFTLSNLTTFKQKKLVLSMDVMALITEKVSQHVVLSLNDNPIGQFTFRWPDSNHTINIEIPRSALKENNYITFHLPTAQTPQALGVNNDTRLLAIAVKQFSIRDSAKSTARIEAHPPI